jgi:hypothetical protein
MGAITATAISLGIAAVGTGASVIQGINASNAKAKADAASVNAANDLQRVLEQNRFEALKVPSLGLNLAQQNMQAWQQSQIQALKESGAAGVLGGLTNVNQQAAAQNQQLAAQADQMQAQRDQMQAQNAQQIEANRVQRQTALAQQRLGGAQTASAQSQAEINAAYQGAIGNLSNAAFNYQYFNRGNVPVDTTNPPVINPNAAGTTPGVAAQSYQMANTAALPATAATAAAGANTGGYNWQAGNSQFNAVVNPAILTQANYPGLFSGQTGDGLNDMYYRNAQLGNK